MKALSDITAPLARPAATAVPVLPRSDRETLRRPGENLAEFMELRGRRILDSAGCLWHSVEGRLFLSLPYHVPQEPDPFELDKMLVSARALGVRFPSVTHPGLSSGIYACQPKNYDMGCVHIKQRPRVRRGLENFEIRRAGDSELRAQGLVINRETMVRQGRYDSEFGDSARWNRLVDAIFRARAVEVYGAYLRSRLAAYLVTCRDGGWLHLMHQMSRTADLELHPNHALTFSVTKLVSEDSTLEGVSYGLAALNDGPGLHEYKLRLGYAFLERTSVFHLHPLAAPAFRSSLLKGGASLLRHAMPHDQRIEKLEAVLTGVRLSARPAPVRATAA